MAGLGVRKWRRLLSILKPEGELHATLVSLENNALLCVGLGGLTASRALSTSKCSFNEDKVVSSRMKCVLCHITNIVPIITASAFLWQP